ncbi:hypothetical protein [Petroclostridium sp. X23]|uniref:hypothetical protein n=1 Tax=Petroclostridium sp. X23 TaxID=3045146 RepID=UPI0024AC9885|nr:hypothetical protein [Petroclostridium sp. X23]WHH57828.1 hypothetical protein QKW49_18690 [Petroclostridium sp. X23]
MILTCLFIVLISIFEIVNMVRKKKKKEMFVFIAFAFGTLIFGIFYSVQPYRESLAAVILGYLK